MTTLIIEGPDLAGKTYAIEKIAKHFNSGFVLKNSYRPKGEETTKKIYLHYFRLIIMIDEFKDKYFEKDPLVILDRFYPSQAVYSYLRGEDELTSRNIKVLDGLCKNDMKLIYLDTDLKLLETRFDALGDEHIKRNNIRKLKERYEEFLKITQLKVLRLDTLKKDWIKEVKEFVK